LLLALWATTATAQHPSWPSSIDGLEFRWETGTESNTVPSTGPVERLCRLVPTGEAMFNRFWAMSLSGGRFDAEPAMSSDLLDVVRTGTFALEMVVTPALDDYPDPKPFARFGPLAVVQHGARLLAVDGEASALLGTVESGVAHHVVLSAAGSVTAFLDGRAATTVGFNLDPSAWTDARLAFGGSMWRGDVEGVAIYGRTVGAAEAVANYRAYRTRIEARTGLPRLTVRARLVQKRDIPRPTVYPDSLVVFDYRVESRLAGTYAGDKVLVAHYGNLNGERRRATADLRVGRVYRLHLEPFDDHPQLAALHKVANHEDVHLPVFFAVADPAPD